MLSVAVGWVSALFARNPTTIFRSARWVTRKKRANPSYVSRVKKIYENINNLAHILNVFFALDL